MIKIGILGDIGSGKSFLSKLFGYPVFNADKEVSNIYKKNKNCFIKLKKILPKYIISFPIKKKQLQNAVLENKNNLKKIERIVHPEVKKNLKNFIKLNKSKKVLIFDIPLLLENKIYKNNFVLVYVDAKKKDINKKLRERKNYNERIIKKLRNSQLHLEIKKKKANYIIKNKFKKKHLKNSVKILLRKILKNERNST
tara:strand:- start:677 stop:1267 length:591 start_codon:yes stop_codon:yes gene_type:complete